MADEHQLYALVAKAILDSRKDTENQISAEEAKQMSKCIIDALADGGFEIKPVSK